MPAPEPGSGFWRRRWLNPSGRGQRADHPGQVGARQLVLLAVDGEHGLALDDAGVGPQPARPLDAGRAHGAGSEGVDDDVVAGRAVDRVVARPADEDVVPGAPGERVGTVAAD